MFEVFIKSLCSFDQRLLKFAWVLDFLHLLKMAESTKLKLFQKLSEAYIDVYKEKTGIDVQLEVSVEWKEMQKMKDLGLEIAINKKISELKKHSMKKKV